MLLARSMLTHPEIFIMDEPTKGIDVGSKYEIYLDMLKLVEDGKAIIMISSEMPEILGMSDRIMVMHKGQIVEHGDADQIMQHPENPYTKKLLASLPVPDPREQQQHRAHLHELLAQEA